MVHEQRVPNVGIVSVNREEGENTRQSDVVERMSDRSQYVQASFDLRCQVTVLYSR